MTGIPSVGPQAQSLDWAGDAFHSGGFGASGQFGAGSSVGAGGGPQTIDSTAPIDDNGLEADFMRHVDMASSVQPPERLDATEAAGLDQPMSPATTGPFGTLRVAPSAHASDTPSLTEAKSILAAMEQNTMRTMSFTADTTALTSFSQGVGSTRDKLLQQS